MAGNKVLTVLGATLLLVALTTETTGQVSSLCRPNEELRDCGGCQLTCDEPNPICTAVCRMGCYCPDGMLRNRTGHCVRAKDCPRGSKAQSRRSPSPSPPSVPVCGENEVYEFCGVCRRTCDNPNPMCPAQCVRGCFCKEGYVRDDKENCIKELECPNRNYVASDHYQGLNSQDLRDTKPDVNCEEGEEYQICSNCERSCSKPNPRCPAQCEVGCACKEGLLRDEKRRCVTVEECLRRD